MARGTTGSVRPGDAFTKSVFRSIRGSLGRFLAIMGIVALGCGFYAGLQMSGTDMRIASDRFYDGTELWDLRVISTLGLADDDVARIEAIEGVTEIMPSATCDAMARMGDEQIAVRISTIDVDAAEKSETLSATEVASDASGYLNRPKLTEGRWPSAPDECVITSDKPITDFGVGDVVEVISGGDSLDDLLKTRSFKVVGMVSASNYPYTGSFGSTTLGSGMIGQYLYVAPSALEEDAPYTEAYLMVDGACELLSESDAYEGVVDVVRGRLEDHAHALAKERQADLKADAQKTLDEKWEEYEDKRKDTYQELEDARVELEDAREQIVDGERKLADGIAEYRNGLAQYRDGQEELENGERSWYSGYEKLSSQLADAGISGRNVWELRDAISRKVGEAKDGKAQLEDGIAQVDDGLKQARDGEQQLVDGIAQLDDGLEQARDGERQLVDGIAQIDDGLPQARDGEQQLQDGITQLDEGLAQARDGESQLLDGIAQIDEGLEQARGGEQQLQDGIAQIDEGIAQARDGAQQLRDTIAQVDEARAGAAELQAGIDELDGYIAPLEQKRDAMGLSEEEVAQLVGMQAQREDLVQRLLPIQAMIAEADAQNPTLEEQLAALEAQIPALEEQRAGLEAQLPEVQATIAALEAQRAPLAAQLSEVQVTIAGLEEQRAGLVAQLTEVQTTISGLEAQRAELVTQLEEVRATIAELEETRLGLVAQLEEVRATIAELEETRPGLVAQLEEVRATIAELEDTKVDLTKQLESLIPQIAQLEEALDGANQLISSRATLDNAARSLQDAAAQLADAWAQIESSTAELEDARSQYEDGVAEWEDGKREADEKFADALDELNDAQHEIDDIELPELYVLDRTQNEGAATYHADSERIDSIADVFPFMFFLVAALVALTTMTRMVDDERQEIGTYKALGYGTARIASRYLTYAALASVVGAVVGIAILSQVLPFIITSAYSIIYTIPLMDFPLPIDPKSALMAGGLGVGVTLLSTWGAVVTSLREVPATLMLPRAPAAGKRILLERVGPLWRHMSFSWKVTCRNLFRYKRRFFMTVIGISGCTALLLVGFGLHDSIWDIINKQFGPIVHYDTTVGLNSDATSLDVDDVVSYLEGTGEVTEIVRVQQENMRAGGTSGASTSVTSTTHVNVLIPRDVSEMDTAFTFKERLSGEAVPFDENSVLVTEKLANLHGLKVGGQVVLYDQDDVGNAVGEGHLLTVTGVVENYVGNVVYVGRAAWAQLDGGKLPFSTVLCQTNEDPTVRKQLSDALHDMEDVSTVIYSDVTINLYRSMLSVVDMVVVVLIVSAGALAFIVLYNLTNINVGERVREIASLKVLGFTRGEVYAYIYREITILALIGDALGLVLGTFLESFVVTTAEVDYVMFGREIHPPSYAYSFVLTMVFAVMVMFLMRHKLDHVDMVESLKSVD